MVDRKTPTVAADVPIELIVIVKEAQLAIGAIRKLIRVFAGRNVAVLVAEIDALSVREQVIVRTDGELFPKLSL